ncbi:PRAME family member 8-like [Thomomys bottae]
MSLASVPVSVRVTPSLQHLALQGRLSNRFLNFLMPDDVPVPLYPSLFMEVCSRGHTEVLKAVVQAWPFPCLPLGDLEQTPEPEAFQAVLDGLDLLLAEHERPSRWKLQVVDLRKEHPNIWDEGADASMAQISCPDSCSSRMSEEQPLRIAVEHVSIKQGANDPLEVSLLQWVTKRKHQVHLCSRKLQIQSGSISRIQKALLAVQLGCIQELHVDVFWTRETMKAFAPYLSRMKNLRVLNFSRMSVNFYTRRRKDASYSSRYAMHLGQLQQLQELHVHHVFFLYGRLPAVLRSQPPLQILSLSFCPLKEADVEFLSRCPCTRQLKHLRLRSMFMDCFGPQTLRSLLQQVAGTLETLALEDCSITDDQLLPMLPALSQCSKLSSFSFYGNHISIDALQALLSLTARLGHLSQGLYPAPLESYKHPDQCLVNTDAWRFARVKDLLLSTLRALQPSQKIQICTYFCLCTKMCKLITWDPQGDWLVTEELLPGLSALPC